MQVIAQQFVPALVEPILKDYAESVPDAKCGPAPPLVASVSSQLCCSV